MDPLDKNYSNSSTPGLNEASRTFVLETAKWARFLSIVGFVFIGLILLAALFIGFASSGLRGFGGMGGGIVALTYILIALLYFFPVLYLFRAATSLRDGINNNDEGALTTGFENLKSHYKFVGILTIIFLSLYALILLIAMLGSM